MAGDKIFQARRKLRQMAKASLLKMAFSQKEKLCLLGGGTCPFLLEYQCALFCVSETLGHGCQIEKLGLPSDENANSGEESSQREVKLAVGPCLPGLG
jgi:hypothetical protein